MILIPGDCCENATGAKILVHIATTSLYTIKCCFTTTRKINIVGTILAFAENWHDSCFVVFSHSLFDSINSDTNDYHSYLRPAGAPVLGLNSKNSNVGRASARTSGNSYLNSLSEYGIINT